MSSTPKKYVSLEEAAERLGMSNDQLVRLREDGEIRGFADRGTWKFRVEDVDELARSRQADSSPDVPMLEDEAPLPVGEDMSATVLGETPAADDVGEQPTEIRRSDESDDSDSDVKLVGADSDSDITLAPADDPSGSDSDVKLVTEPMDLGSDSDVKLVSEPISEGSDSDVQLIEPAQSLDDSSDSDVALVNDDSSVALDLAPDDSEQASVLSDDVGLALETGSSLTLAADSGISLEADEGITLDTGSDSGISLDSVGDSGISLEDSGEVSGTVPMMDVMPDVEGVEETKFEIPSMEGDSAFELQMEDDSGDDTGVLDLEDSGEVLDDAIFDLEEDETGFDGRRPWTELSTDGEGRFLFCGLPAPHHISLTANTLGVEREASVDLRPGAVFDTTLALPLGGAMVVMGRVRDGETMRPVAGAEVTIGDETVLSDGRGSFLLPSLTAGLHEVRVEHMAYGERIDSVLVRGASAVSMEITLMPEAFELKGLTVEVESERAARYRRYRARGTRVDVMEREAIEKASLGASSVADVLVSPELPFLRAYEVSFPIREGNNRFFRRGICVELSRQRGGGCRMPEVYLNDAPLHQPEFALLDLDPASIQRIEVVPPLEAGAVLGTQGGDGAIYIYLRGAGPGGRR